MSYYTKLILDLKSKSPDFDAFCKLAIAMHDAAAAVNKVANTDLDPLYELILDESNMDSDAFRAVYFLSKFRAFAATVDSEAQALLAIGARKPVPAHTALPDHPQG